MRAILGVILAAGLAGPVAAADLGAPMPVKAPALVAAYNWSGFYVGGNVGYGWTHSVIDDTFTVPGLGSLGTTEMTEDLRGVVGGFHAGYNWQTGALVLGLEGDFDFSGQQFSGPFGCVVGGVSVGGCAVNATDRVRWLSTLRGRAGVAFDRWFVYATGGVAWQNLASDGSVTLAGVPGTTAIFSTNVTKTGFVIGGGVETALWANWTGGVEYLYVDTGTMNVAVATLPTALNAFLGAPAGSSVTETAHLTDSIVRARVSYRF